MKLLKGGSETVRACESCRVPGFCALIVLAFILGVELFDYMVDGGTVGLGGGGDSARAWLWEKNK